VKNKDIGKTLRFVLLSGLILALIIVIIGLLFFLANPQEDDTALQMNDLISNLAEANPIAIIDVGIIILMVIPIAGIMTVMISSVAKRDTGFVMISLLVLALLIIGFGLAMFR